MSQSRSTLVRVFSGLWRILLGVYRAVVVLLVLVIIGLVWFNLRGGAPVHIGNHVALVLHPYGELMDTPRAPGQRLLQQLSGEPPSQTPLRTLRRALQFGAHDPRIAGAVLDLDDMNGSGLAQLQELAAAVDRFRAVGKPVYAYGQAFDQYQYFLAAHANRITLDPVGLVLIQGLGVYGNYFKDALDKLGVQVNVFRVGEYKSAVEPFIRNDMSPDARAANRAWLDDLWAVYGDQVQRARKLPAGAIDDYVAAFRDGLVADHGNGAELALKAGLVDQVATRQQFRDQMKKEFGNDADTGSFRQVDAIGYEQAMAREQRDDSSLARIGLVTVEGDIIDGRSQPDSAGGDTVAGLLERAARETRIKAVVMRVNSPGGSATAAETIRRALRDVQKAGKPVVVSMSTLAASGGYWISMDANRIYAEPTTITGSIGIFGLFPTIDKPLAKLGIHTDGVGTTPLAGAFRIDRPLQPAVADIIQSQIDFGYRNFVDGVAKGRKLPLATVEKIAQGRVWSGVAAKRLGLIDDFGGLPQAVAEAARLARLTVRYRVEPLLPRQHLLARYLGRLVGGDPLGLADLVSSDSGERTLLTPLLRAQRLLQHFNDPYGEYAYCFCRLTPAAR